MELAFLSPLYEHPGSWASAYVDLSQHDEDMGHRRHLTAEAVARQLREQGADEATSRAVYDTLDALRHSTEPYGRAVFARNGEVVLQVPLTQAPPHGLVHWGTLPHVTPLLDLAGEDPVSLVAYIDRTGAGFELRSAVLQEEAGHVTGTRQWPMHRSKASDWSERHFQLKVENTWEYNAREIAEALADCQAETGADLLILCGEERACRSVHEQLPQHLRDRAEEAAHGIGSRLLPQEVEDIRARHVRERVLAEVDRYRAARTPDEERRAAAIEGVPQLVEAAREHRLAELLIRPDAPDTHREVWIGEDPDQLAARRSELRTIGEQHAWPARADDALVRAAVVTDAPVLSLTPVLEETGDEVAAGGMGALLRWK
ncbi:Vms1/Ankzf1 family peptidyl-tRNA hydrolase [Streptomyces sp. NRRL WC-3744]|uniref:baeRF2 domain-containing protein n=1 Tax=Streptomyces sp. NRRL WC-3744 TaxID=1463935 RepID=UPI0004C749EA|nr:Vms1/Ankzf1 family peptidyl-tRNA hydrolase [Streptomyces sp. NRRL WC-3744]